MLDVLIVPAAGKSSRFPGMRPKWMLTHPDGRIMGAAALDGLPRAKDLIVVTSKEIAERYGEERIRRAFLDGLEHTPQRKLRLMTVNQTPHQPATVAAAVATISSKRSIMVKDTDNAFRIPDIRAGMNAVATAWIQDQPLLNARNKCYVRMDGAGRIERCAERKIIGSQFACGLYSFATAHAFTEALKGVWGNPGVYPSTVVNALLKAGEEFYAWEAQGYQDWGTLQDWQSFRSGWRTLFIDVDGVILKNGGQYFDPLWKDALPIVENVAALRRLHATGRVQIILTTARPDRELQRLTQALKRWRVPWDQIVTGLFHGARTVVNDYAVTNPFPSAEALNLVRDSSDLDAMLRGLFKQF